MPSRPSAWHCCRGRYDWSLDLFYVPYPLKLNLFDLQNRQFLPVSNGAMVSFTAFHLERNELRTTLMLNNIGKNSRILNDRTADRYFVVVAAHKQHAIQSMFLPGLNIKPVHN